MTIGNLLRETIAIATAFVLVAAPVAAQTPPKSVVFAVAPGATSSAATITVQSGNGTAVPIGVLNPTTGVFSPQGLGAVQAGIAGEVARAQGVEAQLAPLTSPALTGTPTAPTPTPGTSTTQIGTTAFTAAAVAAEAAVARLAEQANATAAANALAKANAAFPASSAGTAATQNVGPGGVASFGDSRITGAVQAAGGDASGTNVTATGESAALSLAARAAQTANAATLGLSGAFSGANGRKVVIPGGTYPLASDLSPVAADQFVEIAPGATLSGSGKLRLDNLIPYQITPITANDLVSKTYGSAYSGYGNIFQRAAYAKVTVANVPTVAQFGEGDAAVSGGLSWGGNHVGVASVGGGVAIAEELNPVNLDPNGVTYGLVIASAGSYPSANAIQIQANNNTLFNDAIVFNGAGSSVTTGALLKATGGTPGYFIRSANTSFSAAEVDLPSFLVGPTVSGINSRLRFDSSANGNPKLSVAGSGSSPTTNANLNLQGQGTGGVQVTPQNAVALSVTGVASPTAAVGVVNSTNGNPTISAIGAGASPAANANLNLQGLGSGGVQLNSQGAVAFSASGVSSPTAAVATTNSANGNPTLAAIGVGASPATNANLNVQGLGTGGVQVTPQGAVALSVTGVASPTAGLGVTNSASGNPTLSAIGVGSSPAPNANLTLQALGTGGVQMVAGGVVGLTINPPASGTGNSGIKFSASSNGNPTLSPVGTGPSPATNANLTLAGLGTGAVVMASPMRLPTYTVAGLPSCSATYQDAIAVVTDATAPTYRGALTGGGSVRTMVECDGSSWTSH